MRRPAATIVRACLALAIATTSPIVGAGEGPARAASGACSPATQVDRTEILHILRRPVSSGLKGPVEFVVKRARLCGQWGFVVAGLQRPSGGAIHWAGTPCAGDTSHLVGALFQRGGRGWKMLDYALCPSDVAWSDWPSRYGAPQAVFDE